MFATGPAEHPQRARDLNIGGELVDHRLRHVRGGTGAIFPVAFQGAGLHLLETEGQGTFDCPAFHGLTRQEQGAGTGGAVVVDVDHRDAAHAHFIERGLAAGGIAIHVAGIGLLYQFVVNACVLQRQANRLGTHFDVSTAGTRLDERNHADADNVRFLRHCFSPDSVNGTQGEAVRPHRGRTAMVRMT
ncbi:hypothetical protein D9M71_663000 [compost metagenome]